MDENKFIVNSMKAKVYNNNLIKSMVNKKT